MPEVFFTSDLHFNHPRILGFCNRPFDSVPEMNEGLIHNWNSVVSKKDTVYLLGDACMGERTESLQYLAALKGHIKWVPGNHDYWHPVHKKDLRKKWKAIYSQFAELLDTQVIFEEFLLCHFPYKDVERHQDKWEDWLPKFEGRWLLHGHIHSSQAWDPERLHCYDVGVDANRYAPISLDLIRDSIKHYEKLEALLPC